MSQNLGLTWQPSLFGGDEPAFDPAFSGIERIHLDPTAWVDWLAGWVTGSDRPFEEILELRHWHQRPRKMYDQKVREPRLVAPWNLRSGEPLEPAILEKMRVALSERYRIEFDSVGFNLYRHGMDPNAYKHKEIVDDSKVMGEQRYSTEG